TPSQTPTPDPGPARVPSATWQAVVEFWRELGMRTGRSGPWWVEAVISVLAVLVGVVGGAALGPIGLLIGLVQILPLPWRRAQPLLVAIVVAAGCLLQLIVIDQPHPANVAVLVVVYSAAAFGD